MNPVQRFFVLSPPFDWSHFMNVLYTQSGMNDLSRIFKWTHGLPVEELKHFIHKEFQIRIWMCLSFWTMFTTFYWFIWFVWEMCHEERMERRNWVISIYYNYYLVGAKQYTSNSMAYREKNRKLEISNDDKFQRAEKSSANFAIQTMQFTDRCKQSEYAGKRKQKWNKEVTEACT